MLVYLQTYAYETGFHNDLKTERIFIESSTILAPQNNAQQAFRDAKARAAARLKGSCLELLKKLSGVADDNSIPNKLQDYLDEVTIGDKFLDENLQRQDFPTEFHGAYTLKEGLPRGAGNAVTAFNVNSSVFTGIVHLVDQNTGIPTGNVAQFVDRIGPKSSLYGLSLSEIQELSILHELAHAFDPEETWHDFNDPKKVAELNNGIRKACF